MNRLLLLGILFTLSSFSLAAVSNYDQEIREYEQEIKGKQSEIQKLYKKIEKLKQTKEKSKTKEDTYRQEIKRVEEEINLLNKEIKKFEQAKRETEKKIHFIEEVYQDIERERINLAGAIKKEINLFYLKQKISSQPHFATRRAKEDYYLLTLLKQKEDFYQVNEKKKKELEKEKETLFLKKKELEKEKEKKQVQEKEKKNIKKDKEVLLAQAEAERIKAEKEIENLKKTSLDLEKIIFNLEKKKKETEEAKKQAILAREDFASKKGYLPWPVEGEVIVKFGRQKHPEYNTYVVNNGIRIRPRSEKRVNAIAQGKIVYAAEFQTYGKTIILDHEGGFYSVYGSLDEILVKEGKKVTFGEQIANLGNEPLYFELREGGEPTDPLVWLKK